jgi:hypothetical protein
LLPFFNFSKLILPKIVYNAFCQNFLKARAHDQGLKPFLSLSKIAKRLEPSSSEPRIRSTTRSVWRGTDSETETALPDGGFLRQICKILADLKVVWQAKNISGGLPISGGFLADLTNSAWFVFVLRILAVLKSVLAKKQTCFSIFFA